MVYVLHINITQIVYRHHSVYAANHISTKPLGKSVELNVLAENISRQQCHSLGLSFKFAVEYKMNP